MAKDVQDAIRAMLQSLREGGEVPAGRSRKPVVCISREYGTGGDDIAAKLAARLGVELYDSAILGKIAQRTHADPEAVRLIDEAAGKVGDLWLYSLLTGQDLSRDTYKRHLVNVIASIGRVGGVIVGRGAHIVLANTTALRVRITGSIEVCAKRVAAAENLTAEEARRRIEEVNHERAKFIWDTFQVRLNDPAGFDITINTDRVADMDAVVDVLAKARELIAAPQ